MHDATRVFLSYPRERSEHVRKIRRLIALAGFDPWMDSDALGVGDDWKRKILRAIRSSDVFVALLSRETVGGFQEKELHAAISAAPSGHPGESLTILPCLVDTTGLDDFGELFPILRHLHAIKLTNVEQGWSDLHKSLCAATRAAGLPVPVMLRSAPCEDLNRAGVARIVTQKGFFNTELNADGVPAAEKLIDHGLVVEDPITGRMWTKGCVYDLPEAPFETKEDKLAQFTLPEKRSDAEQARVNKRAQMVEEMRRSVEGWVARMNNERFGDYDDWRMPTLEESLSLMTRDRHRGNHISSLFSDHGYVRTCDTNLHSQGIQGIPGLGFKTIWCVSYAHGDCQEVPEEAPVPLRFVRTVWRTGSNT